VNLRWRKAPRLRQRLALYFALGSSALLVVSRLVTLESFRQVQEYDLDHALLARADQESSEFTLVGRKALEEEYNAKEGEPDPLEQLTTYGALYRADGTLVADTPSFSHAPTLKALGIDVSTRGRAPFDFRFRGSILRGVLVPLKGRSNEGQYLLVAASRRDMDADARQLLAVGWWVLAAAIPMSLAIGWWFGRRTTRGIEALATSARRVATGELDVTFEPEHARDEEVLALGSAIREMVERLKTLAETERRFASHAAHELRSPLAVLRGELELALRRPRTSEVYAGFLRDALDATKRLVDLAEDLLVVARAGTRAPRPVDEELEVSILVDEAIAASRARGPEAPPVEVDGDGGFVRGVRVDLVRMLRNLIDNAVAHGKPSSPVRVKLARGTPVARSSEASDTSEAQTRIIVEDDGLGIGPDDEDRVFEHFHRGAEAREISGAGLGLGIAREVAVRHGGDLVLENAANPTRFVVSLPTAART
jgi:two-component system, OmpR family, sensor kinase